MACNITTAIPIDCMDSIGGIKTAYIGTDIVISSTTLGADNEITGMTGSGDFYQYALPKDTGNITETDTISETNGTVFSAQVVSIFIHKLSAEKRKEIQLLIRNRNIKLIVEDNNGNLFLVGKTRGATVTASTTVTGTAPGDASQYTLVFSANEPEKAYHITSLSALSGFTIHTA